jgi:hypothetical protein
MDRINEHGIEPGAYSGPGGVVTVVAVASKVEKDGVVSILPEATILYRDSQTNSRNLTMISKEEFLLHYKLI